MCIRQRVVRNPFRSLPYLLAVSCQLVATLYLFWVFGLDAVVDSISVWGGGGDIIPSFTLNLYTCRTEM